MQLKVGDKVRFLNEVGQGTVVGLIDARTVMVLTDEGFDIPMLVSDLIPSTPIARYGARVGQSTPRAERGTENRHDTATPVAEKLERADNEQNPAEKKNIHIPLRAPVAGVQQLILGFAPEDDHDAAAGPFRLYAVNEGACHMMLTLSRWEGARLQTFFAAKLKPNTARYVGTIPMRDLFLYAAMRLQALYFSDRTIAPMLPESADLELRLSRFTRPGSFQANRYIASPMLCISALSPSPFESKGGEQEQHLPLMPGGEEDGRPNLPPPQPEETAQQQEVILNLQMAALAPRQTALAPEEQLAFQVQHFVRGMEQALANGLTQRLVVIHGLGNNQLRRSVISTLRADYSQCRYQDASFKEYDYGATLIILPHQSK